MPSEHRASAAAAWRRALEMTAPIAQNPTVTLPVAIEHLADRFGAAPALISEREHFSYRELAARADRYARWALRHGIGAGDVVCLLMPNCAEYMAIWLGITRVGGVVALVNTHLVGDALAHSIAIVAPRHVIVDAGLLDAFAGVRARLAPEICCWAHGADDWDLPRIDGEIAEAPDDTPIAQACRLPTLRDRALYIYTSGTTGLPKAAAVSHFRLMQWSYWFAGMMDTSAADRMYNCLPMYHSIGGVVATGALLVTGGSVLIRERFSAGRFWDDVGEGDCTLFQYIGELCRYLLNSPSHPRETGHRLRLCAGNGLRADVWQGLQRRFHIPRVLEFYAATEASFSLYNCEGEPGAIGRIPSFLAHRFPVALVKSDAASGEPLRDAAGFCLRCSANEAGEAIGKIADAGSAPGGRFEGYADAPASERKILRHVFAEGDAWYRTGDLMRRDKRGYFYFVDRIGDTFRWKGENVSTTEVEQAIVACPGVKEAVVYGVTVPGTEGRAGMATLAVDGDFAPATLHARLTADLPSYARPVFLRLRQSIETTGTFKPRKQLFAQEGYDPAVIGDALYVDDGGFVALDAAVHRRICSGDLRL